MELRNLRVGAAVVDLRCEQHPGDVGIRGLRRDGQVRIVVVK